jgi:hypothetical protein
MASQAYEQLLALGAERGTYTPDEGMPVCIVGLVEPIRRTDSLGNQSFLSKTYEIWFVKSETEGVTRIKAGFDTFAIKLDPSDDDETPLRITKIYPERDQGLPGDGIGMWHVEAVV